MSGTLFACHGAQKLFGVLGGQAERHDPEGLAAGLIELLGGTLIALGLATSWAAFVASGEMAVVYCFLFLYIAARGSGALSVEAVRRVGPGARSV